MKIKSQYKFDICDLTSDEFVVIHDAVARYAKEVSDTSVQRLLDVLDRRRRFGLPVEEAQDDDS
jgi:hypothetical protein